MIGYASGLSAWSRSRKAVTDSLPCLCFLLSGALAVVSEGVDAVFHLAAVDSGAADANFDLGMKVNFDATRAVLTRCRRLEVRPLKLLYLACELWSMACELWSMACELNGRRLQGVSRVSHVGAQDCAKSRTESWGLVQKSHFNGFYTNQVAHECDDRPTLSNVLTSINKIKRSRFYFARRPTRCRYWNRNRYAVRSLR